MKVQCAYRSVFSWRPQQATTLSHVFDNMHEISRLCVNLARRVRQSQGTQFVSGDPFYVCARHVTLHTTRRSTSSQWWRKTAVFLDVTPCRLVDRDQRSRESCRPHLGVPLHSSDLDNEGSTIFRNVIMPPPNYTASHPTRQQSSRVKLPTTYHVSWNRDFFKFTTSLYSLP
jgi:hypothetical protein